ncbi:GH3 auxin-responsive promoter [Planctomycetes bacterium Pan216]|uniref:GH3 auxin-responsive promoter n=1 Tax=Kolteria novifilia TaxID=2527975 RepID=A0A518BAH6_9BACT|nr:GH3 auxin-responsive promoter [Planctomycetes bacterium Pan216]
MFRPVKWLLTKIAAKKAHRVREKFHALTNNPIDTQRKRLFSLIERNRNSAFGRDHHFSEIKTVADFRRHLPIATYEQFHPYIERVRQGEVDAMFDKQRVVMFAMTSGTTATRKYVPVTEQFLNDYRRGWHIWGIHMFEDHQELLFKTMLQFTSDWQEFSAPSGIPCGSISGLTVQMQMYVVRKTFLLPPPASKIKDIQSKYYLAWRLGLVRDAKILSTANPSTVVNFGRFLNEHREQLIRDVHDGTLTAPGEIPEGIYKTERKRLRAMPERARELEKIVEREGRLLPKDVWPNLGLLCNWTGGSVANYMRHYPELYGEHGVRDIGLIASEGRMTIPIADGTPAGVLEITSSFFEFVPVEEMDSADPTVLESHELQEGKDYYILLTTSSGLYRYNIYDVVRCVGWHNKTPLLAFLNKGANFSNLTGEKISEHQVVNAVSAALAKCEHKLNAFALAPCWHDQMPYYGLFVEESDFADREHAQRFAGVVERELQVQNSEYESKRETARLGPIQIKLLPAKAWRQWDRERLKRTGGTAEQYKHPCLIADTEFADSIPLVDQVTQTTG